MSLQKELKKLSDPKIAKQSQHYFKTGEGEYGHGDTFIGVKSADLRRLAKENTDYSVTETKKLIRSKTHEERLLGLFILVYRFKKSKEESEKTKIYKLYVSQFRYINNWDLVDVSCPHIVGPYLMEKDRKVLYQWAKSNHLWTKRIAMVSNWWFIRNGDLKDVFKIAKVLLKDDHDLIHKAVGWMLREAGKKDRLAMEKFLTRHYQKMPRTMLRYAIEKLPEKRRQQYLKGTIPT